MAQVPRPDPRSERRTPGELMVRIGMLVLQSFRAMLRIVWFFLGGFLRWLWYLLCQAGRFFRMIGGSIRRSFAAQNAHMQTLLADVHTARGKGVGVMSREIVRFLGRWLFGENGLFHTGFNYLLPVISIVFLVGMVNFGMGLDYALAVTVSGEEIGIVTDEQIFEDAREEVRQRIALTGEDIELAYTPVYNLRIVNDNDSYATSHSIADRLLIGSHAELVDAWGVYVDGKFVGAVENRDAISDAMAKELLDYSSTLAGTADEVYYTKEITYQQGVYLKASLSPKEDMLNELTAAERTESRYVVKPNDTPALIAATHDMTERELLKLNPRMKTRFKAGMVLKVYSYTRTIPIAYTRTMTVTDYIDFSSVKVETSALNLGVEKVIAKGVLGERTSEVLVTYIDGAEQSREVLSTAITKIPIPQQIGVGTYKPQPASTSTVLEGSGQFGWPVNGGFISDTFGGERNHKGLDIAAPMGTEIYAAEAGTVVEAGWNNGGYGNYVIIDHPDGYRTLYGHASSVVAYAGQQVEKGQLIALVGSTGDSTGPHCHFEVRINNICQNPADYLNVNTD